MDTTFDFRISQPACVEALETYRRVETILADEREKQKQTIETLKPNWAGYSAEAFAVEMGQFLDNGEYNHTYDKVKGIRQLLEEVLPEVNTLLARCEGFAEQLENDEYIEPMRPMAEDNTIRNGGILSLNYGMINVIANLCYEIEEENRVLTNTLKDIAYQCGGLIGNTESNISAIEAASRKVNRVANFRESFQRYAMGVRNLEYEMNLQLCRLAEDTCGLGEKVGISQTELESGEMDQADIYDLSFMSDVELTALMEKCIEDDDIETMKCVAGQIFAQDSMQWSEAEAMFIAQTMNHAFEKGELEIIELYTDNLLMGTHTGSVVSSVNAGLGATYSAKYVVNPDVKKIELIMNSLNAKEQGMTYYTLNRLANMEVNVVVELDSQVKLDCGTYHVEAQKVFGEIQLVIHAEVLGEYSEFTMEACDMGEVIPAGVLKDRNISEVETERLRLSVVNDTDVMFMEKLVSKEYAEIFDISPDELSDLAGEGLTDYILLLEAHHQTEEMENIANAVLKTDREHNMISGNTKGQYISLICDNLLAEMDDLANDALLVKDDSVLLNALTEKSEKIYGQYGLWKAIDHVYNYEFGLYDMGEVASDFKYGRCHAEISELTAGEDNIYDFQFRIAGAELVTDELDGKYIDVKMEKLSGEFYYGEMENARIEELREKQKEVAMDAVVDSIMAFVPFAVPEAELIYPIVELVLDADYIDMGEKEIDELYGCYREKVGEERSLDLGEFSAVLGAVCEYNEMSKQIEESKSLMDRVMFSQAIDIDFLLKNEKSAELETAETIKIESQVAEAKVLLPRMANNIGRFSVEGIAAVLADEGMSVKEIEKIQNELRVEYAGYENFEYVISGGNISQVPADKLFDYFEDMNGFMEERGYGTCNVFEWFRGEKVQ